MVDGESARVGSSSTTLESRVGGDGGGCGLFRDTLYFWGGYYY